MKTVPIIALALAACGRLSTNQKAASEEAIASLEKIRAATQVGVTWKIQSGPPSAEVTQWLQSSESVSTTRWPRWPSSSSTVDFPVPDIPVTRILDMPRG